MFEYRLLLEMRYGFLGSWYHSMTETFAYWLLLVLRGSRLGMPGDLGKIACWGCLYVG